MAQDVIDDLAGLKQWEPSTVKTLLNRLIRKGALNHRKHGKAYLYSAAVDEEACRTVETNSLLQRVFDGAFSPMVAHFVRSRKLTKKELAELEALLRSERSGK